MAEPHREPPRVGCVCPRCRGPLEERPGAVACAACALAFRRVGDGVDFLGEIAHAHTEAQRAIYDGDHGAGIRLAYGDREEYRRRLEGLYGHARATGLPSFTMRDAMNDEISSYGRSFYRQRM